jgi:hypothetical protein
LKVAHFAKDENTRKQFNDLFGLERDDQLEAQDLTALLIIVSKSIQLTNKLVAHVDENNIPLTVDQMKIKKYNKYRYGKAEVKGEEAEKGTFQEDEEAGGLLDISGAGKFCGIISKSVDLNAVQDVIGQEDEAFSAIDPNESRTDGEVEGVGFEQGYDSTQQVAGVSAQEGRNVPTPPPSSQRIHGPVSARVNQVQGAFLYGEESDTSPDTTPRGEEDRAGPKTLLSNARKTPQRENRSPRSPERSPRSPERSPRSPSADSARSAHSASPETTTPVTSL